MTLGQKQQIQHDVEEVEWHRVLHLTHTYTYLFAQCVRDTDELGCNVVGMGCHGAIACGNGTVGRDSFGWAGSRWCVSGSEPGAPIPGE